MKQLIVIVGPNAVGKSTTAEKIVELCPKSAFIDTDWCRVMNPFLLTDVTKKTVIENMYSLLRNYLVCEEISNVVFVYSWHGERKEMYDRVMKRLRDDEIKFQENIVVLKCSESENRRRALADNRDAERVERGIRNTLSFYDKYDYPCIDTTDMSIMEVVEQVCKLINPNLSSA